MASGKIFSNGSQEIEVSDSIAIFTAGTAKVYYYNDLSNMAPVYEYNSSVTNQELVLTPGSGISKVRVEADAYDVLYETGDPNVVISELSPALQAATEPFLIQAGALILSDGSSDGTTIINVKNRTTIADASTVTPDELTSGILFQDASGGNVTMTSPDAVDILGLLSSDLPDNIGFEVAVVSNDPLNTSTFSGGSDVTLVGSGVVTETGGRFAFVKTSPTEVDMLRVG